MTYCLSPSCPRPDVQGQPTTCPHCGATLQLKGQYRAIKLLGQGGFGRTFLAVDEATPTKDRCVIKQFFPQQASPQQDQAQQQAVQLFHQEAQRLRGLRHHPQIPDLLDCFEADGQQYLIQAFIDGDDLSQSIASRQGLPEIEIIRLLQTLLPVVQFMHEQQIIHRDIKPANIIRRDRDQTLFLVDLGAAKVATGTALAMTGTVIGSAEYTAPEQARGKASFASDIYSLGMTCLHLLTGVSPFDLYDINEGQLAWKDYLKAPIDDHLAQILECMTQDAIRQRYDSAEAVLQDLQAFTPVPGQQSQFVDPAIHLDQERDASEVNEIAVAIAERSSSALNLETGGELASTCQNAMRKGPPSKIAHSTRSNNTVEQLQRQPSPLNHSVALQRTHSANNPESIWKLIPLLPFALMTIWILDGEKQLTPPPPPTPGLNQALPAHPPPLSSSQEHASDIAQLQSNLLP